MNVVNESARKITGVPVRRGRLRCQRISVSRSKRGRGRRWVMPSRPVGAGRFESGASALPSRLSVRIAPNTRERSGVPCSSWWCASASAFSDAMSTDSGHSLLHALHSRQRSRISCRRSSPSAACGSGSLSALTSAFARPRVACSSSRVAM